MFDVYEKQAGKCSLTGKTMTFRRQELGKGRNDRYLYNLSVDRIDSLQGYVPGNIHLVCSIVNTIKWDLPITEFVEICTLIAKQQSKKILTISNQNNKSKHVRNANLQTEIRSALLVEENSTT